MLKHGDNGLSWSMEADVVVIISRVRRAAPHRAAWCMQSSPDDGGAAFTSVLLQGFSSAWAINIDGHFFVSPG